MNIQKIIDNILGKKSQRVKQMLEQNKYGRNYYEC